MKRTYVLVHGAWMGGFSWRKVAPLLEAAGHKVVAVELPGHGEDSTPLEGLTLDSYRDAVLKALPAEGGILVGHSMAGMVISAAAEAAPERVSQLVYVAAYLPKPGESLYQLSMTDEGSKVGQFWHQDDPEHYSPATIRREGLVTVFAADCSEEDQQLVLDRHRPEPLPPVATPVALSAERFGSVKKLYVATTLDQCVSYGLQKRMIAACESPVEVTELESGHCPFFSKPEQLAEILLGVGA